MLRERLAELISQACDGDPGVAEILAADRTLPALGVTSLAYLRLIDALEVEFDIELDPDPASLDTLDGLARYIAERSTAAGR